MSQDGYAGERWKRFSEVCETVIEHDRLFSDKDVEFCMTMHDKFDTYGPRTFTSVAQGNWLNSLEQRCKEEGLL